jgi:hypothetical protein
VARTRWLADDLYIQYKEAFDGRPLVPTGYDLCKGCGQALDVHIGK